MPEINLLQTEKRSRRINVPQAVSGKGVLLVLAGILAAELIGYGVFFALTKKAMADREQKLSAIMELEKKIRHPNPEFEQAIKTQGAIKTITQALASHIHWTQVWKELGGSTLKSARYISITGTADNFRFVVEGKVVSYFELGKLMLGLQSSSKFKEVHLVNSGKSQEGIGGVDFAIAVVFDPPLLSLSGGTRLTEPPSGEQ